MKSMMKKKTLVLCSTLAAIACSAAFVTPVIFSYAETTTLSETKGNFYVVDGASVKKDSSAGIRFTTVVGKAYYENVMEADPTAEFHTEIYSALTDALLQDVTYTKGLKYRENGAYTMDASAQNVDGYEYHVAITYDSIDDVSVKLTLGYDMYVKSYVEVNGDKIYAESNETVRSMKDVAELASEDGEEGLEKYYADVTENDSVVYHEQAGDNSVAVTGLPADTTETGELTAYIGGTALTDATFTEGKVTFGADTLAKLKPGANYQLTVLGANKGVFVAPFTSVTNVLTQDNFVSALYASGVVSDTVFAATDEASVAAVAKARNTYFVMEEDVTLDKTAYGAHSQSFWNAVYLIGGHFMGTLNAQGHKLTCNFVDPNLAGVFRYLEGTIRNLNYEMNSTYTVSAADTRGFFAFAFTATTVVENCRISIYTKATSDGKTAVTDSKDSAFIVGACQLYNTGIIRNCILENKTYDPTSGKMVDKEVWYSSINAPVENCVFISTLDKLMKPNAGAAPAQYTPLTILP